MSSTRTAVLLYFNEVGVPASDAAGNLKDLLPPIGITGPDSIPAFTGRGIKGAAGKGLLAREAVADATRLTRSMAIEAIVSIAAGAIANGTYTICARGLSGLAAERRLYGLQLVTTGAPSSPVVKLQMFWERSDGTEATIDGQSFIPPTGFFYVAAVRRWTLDAAMSTVAVTVEYYINGNLIGTQTAASGDEDIGEGSGGALTVGMRGDGSGAFENHFIDTIDDIRISGDERSAEEIRSTYRKIWVYPQQAYDVVKAFLPPGDAYSGEPDSVIQRELAIEGDAIGKAWGLAEELADDFLPDRATNSLARWEAILGLSARPSDTIAQRRKSILAYLAKNHGYQRSEILHALTPEDSSSGGVLDCADSDLEIVENSNRFDDAFDGAALSERWYVEENEGTVTFDSGANTLEIAFQSGDDATWNGTTRKAVFVQTSVDGGEAEVAAHVHTLDITTDDDFAGVWFYNHVTYNAHFFGVQYVPGTGRRWVYRIYQDGVLGSAVVLSSSAPPTSDFYMRMQSVRGQPARVTFAFNLTGFDGSWTSLGGTNYPTIPDIGYVGAFASSGASSAAADGSILLDELRIWQSRNRNVFNWYVFRDPGLGGNPDIPTANAIVQKMKPAHTQGAVITNKVFLCDDSASLCDQTPLGG